MRWYLLMGFLFLSACVSTFQANEALRSNWVGRSADEFVARYGPPKTQYRMQNGDSVLAWSDTEQHHADAVVWDRSYVDPTTGQYIEDKTKIRSASDSELTCDLQLDVTPNGVIKDVNITRDSGGRLNSRCAQVFE